MTASTGHRATASRPGIGYTRPLLTRLRPYALPLAALVAVASQLVWRAVTQEETPEEFYSHIHAAWITGGQGPYTKP